ncbi:hypothetical protein ACFX5U_12170 [Sphingobacterium sp. SG20118]|uniref:hypothetical protein n=1 Tax=Sphingobacterium sp. SG20118 TaxID=3367156 RepID=UPI0037DFC554
MDNFDWTSFTKRIAIKSSLSEIYGAWTIATNLEKWFLESVIFHSTEGNLLEPTTPVEGGVRYDWYWYLDSAPMHGEILNANGKDFLQFTFEGSTIVDVRLSTHDEYVIVETTAPRYPSRQLFQAVHPIGLFKWLGFLSAQFKVHL